MTALNTTANLEGQSFRLDAMEALIQPGTWVALEDVYVTGKAYGPVTTIRCWAKGYQEPLYLVDNLTCGQEAYQSYQKRFRIEMFLSDQKSRGLNLHKSH